MAAPTRFTISRLANCTSWSHSLNNAQLRQSRNFKTLSSNSRLISGYNVQGNSIYFSKTGAFRHGPSVECSAAPATTLGFGRGQSLRSFSVSKFTSRSQEITSISLKRQVRNLSLPFETTTLLQPTNHSHDLVRGIRSRRGTDGLEADVDGEPRRASGPSLAEQEDRAWVSFCMRRSWFLLACRGPSMLQARIKKGQCPPSLFMKYSYQFRIP